MEKDLLLPNSVIKKAIDLDFCIVEFKANDFLIVRFKTGIHIEAIHINKLWEISKAQHIQTGRFHRYLVVTGQDTTVSKEARELGSSPSRLQYICASATVIGSLHHRLLTNFIIKFVSMVVPAKMFTNEEKALEWLSQFDPSKPPTTEQ